MAILYGTQSNGETLPVLVDQFGNLLAKGIEGAKGETGETGQPGQQGPPGQNGQPGTPGQGVPLPYGDDGSYLVIVDGIPQWVIPPGPGPGPEPGDPSVSMTDAINPSPIGERMFINDMNQQQTVTSQFDEWLRSQSYFNSPGSGKQGIGIADNNQSDWFRLDILDAAGYILEVNYAVKSMSNSNASPVTCTLTSNSTNLVGVQTRADLVIKGDTVQASTAFTFLVNRPEVLNAKMNWSCVTGEPKGGNNYAFLQSYKLYEPARWIARQLRELKKAAQVA